MIEHFTPTDFNQNPLLQVVIHPSATAPSTPSGGQIWYDETTERYKWWHRSSGLWMTFGATGLMDNTFGTLGSAPAFYKDYRVGSGTILATTGGAGIISANQFNFNPVIATVDGGTNATGYSNTNVLQWDGTRIAAFPPAASGAFVVVSQSGIGVTGIFVGTSGQGLVTNGFTWLPGYIPTEITAAVVKYPTGHNRNNVSSSSVQTLLALLKPSGNPPLFLAGGESKTFYIRTSGVYPLDFAVDYNGNVFQAGSKHYFGSGILTLSGVASGTNFVFPGPTIQTYIAVATGMSTVTGHVLKATTGAGVGVWGGLFLNDLEDVTSAGATSGQALVSNGTGWVPGTVAGGPGGTAQGVYTTTISAGQASYVVTHSLGTRAVLVDVWRTASPYQGVSPQINRSGVNDIQVIFSAVTAVDHDVLVMASATGRYSGTLAAGATGYNVFHNFNTRACIAQVYRTNSPYQDVNPEIRHTSTSGITVLFGTATAVDHDIVILA